VSFLPACPLLFAPNDHRGALAAAVREVGLAVVSGPSGGSASRNVLAYGADPTGVADSAPAIQAALDDYVSNRPNDGTGPRSDIYVPPGVYLVAAPLNLNDRTFAIHGDGVASRIVANFNDYVFKKSSPTVLCPSIRDLAIVNTGAAGGALQLAGTHELVLANLWLQAHICYWRGLPAGDLRESGNLTTGLFNVTFRAAGSVAGSFGMKGQNHFLLVNCDAQLFETAYQLGGINVNVFGGRTEVCGTAFKLGLNEQDAPAGWSGTLLGHYGEANDVGIDVVSAGQAKIGQCRFFGTANAPSGMSQNGFKVQFADHLTMEDCFAAGSHSRAGFFVASGVGSVEFRECSTNNNLGKTWDVQTTKNVRFDRCDTPAEAVAAAKSRELGTRSGSDVLVPSGATYVDVLFPPAFPAYGAVISTATPGSSGALAAGNYFYYGAVVNAAGESTPAADQGAYYIRNVTAGANGSVACTFVAMAADKGVWHRRVYRGRGSWVPNDWPSFDCYYDLPANSDAPWTDTGAPPTALASPRLGDAADLGLPEVDALYKIDVRPAWNTTAWISGRTTLGFRINFGTAPVGDSTLDWTLVRT
jgi:hypothetical protein